MKKSTVFFLSVLCLLTGIVGGFCLSSRAKSQTNYIIAPLDDD